MIVDSDHSVVTGDVKDVFGDHCTIYGNVGNVFGDHCVVHGDVSGLVEGDRCIVYGRVNTVSGDRCKAQSYPRVLLGGQFELIRVPREESANNDLAIQRAVESGHLDIVRFLTSFDGMNPSMTNIGNSANVANDSINTIINYHMLGARSSILSERLVARSSGSRGATAERTPREERTPPEEKEPPEDITTEIESMQCVICMDNQKRVATQPCGHVAACVSCYKKLAVKICPICRHTVYAKSYVYL